jgi:hypothetical protein
MKKPNIHFLYSTAKLAGSRALRSASPAPHTEGPLRATYDNVNLKNHLPFADKSTPDILKQKERYKTFYQDQLAPAALKLKPQELENNLAVNNSLNKGYKTHMLDQHYKLGVQKTPQIKSEQQAR